MKQKHGIPDAERLAPSPPSTVAIDVIDGNGCVVLVKDTPYDAGLTPEQARYIAQCLMAAADRVDGGTAKNNEDVCEVVIKPGIAELLRPRIANHVQTRAPQPPLEDAAAMFIRDLPELFALHPHGITSRVVLQHCGIKYGRALQVLHIAEKDGHGKYVLANGVHGAKVLLPLDASEPVKKALSRAQEAILQQLTVIADKHGLSEATAQVARDAKVATGSLGYCLGALEAKGYIMLAKPEKTGISGPTYQVLKTLEARNGA